MNQAEWGAKAGRQESRRKMCVWRGKRPCGWKSEKEEMVEREGTF